MQYLILDKKPNYVDYMTKNYKPGFTYQDFAKDFTGELFDPEYWAEVSSKIKHFISSN